MTGWPFFPSHSWKASACARSRTLSEESPITEAIADGAAVAADCMASPRSFTSFRPPSNLAAAQCGAPHCHACSLDARANIAGRP